MEPRAKRMRVVARTLTGAVIACATATSAAQPAPAPRPAAAVAVPAKPAAVPAKPAAAPAKPAAQPAPKPSAAPTAAKPAPAATPAGQVSPSAPVTAPALADPEKLELTLAQATAGLKGTGGLVATFEVIQDGKPLGLLHCDLLPEQAPLAVANFIGLARGLRPFKEPRTGQWIKKPLFDGNIFHRVIPGFLIQTGDPQCLGDLNCAGRASAGNPGYAIPDEIRSELRFDRPGMLAMANKGPGTSGAQIFITEKEASWLTGFHTIFGQCSEAALIQQIASQETSVRDMPKTPIVIKKVTIARKLK